MNWSGLATGHRRKHTYMYEQRELFKDLLRDHQIPVFGELLNAGNKTLLKAPMDFGKTFIACAYVSYLFQIKQIGSATFSIPNYEMRSKIIDDLHRVGLKDKLIVCLEGKERAWNQKGKRKTDTRTVLKDIRKQKISGVIDKEFIQRRWPNANPYKVLMALQDCADVLIVHHSFLKSNKRLRKTDILIVDDGDLMNRDRVFLVKRYEVYQQHLQAMKEDSSDAKEIQDKLKLFIERNRYNKKVPALSALEFLIEQLLRRFPDNPDELEKKNVFEIEQMNPDPDFDKVIDVLREKVNEGKNEDEKLQTLIDHKLSEIKLGLNQSANPVKWNSIMEVLKNRIKFYAKNLENEIEKELNYAISAHLDYRLEEFFNALLDPEFHVKETRMEGAWSLLEIYLENGANFMDVVRQYHKVLWISATANPEEFKGFRLVRSDVDPNAEHKHVTFIAKEKIPEVIATLKSHNIFVVTNSGKGAKEFTEKYGCGEILTKETFDVIFRNAKNGAGIIAVGYVNGIGSRGLDDLAELFDIAIVDSWIYRSVMQENGKFYGEDHMQNNLSDTTQIIARIMRGSKDHVLFVVKEESEAGSKFSEFLKEQNPSWNYADSSSDYRQLLSKIPERTQMERPKTVLRKSVQKLKDGTFSIIYTGRTTGDDLDRYPDSLEF